MAIVFFVIAMISSVGVFCGGVVFVAGLGGKTISNSIPVEGGGTRSGYVYHSGRPSLRRFGGSVFIWSGLTMVVSFGTACLFVPPLPQKEDDQDICPA